MNGDFAALSLGLSSSGSEVLTTVVVVAFLLRLAAIFGGKVDLLDVELLGTHVDEFTKRLRL